MSERKYFGTDGVRAVAGAFPLTASWVMQLGAAAGEVLKQQNPRASVVIGKDTRQSGDMLEAALAAGLTSRGVNVIHVGVLPTPGVSYLTRHLNADAGVVISASHNPYEDNGIKFFGADGQKLRDATELEIEAAIDGVDTLPPVTGVDLGGVTNYAEAERLYVNYLKAHAPDLSGLRIAMDCANGA
ncbi:MAG: phosphoglucosamine mutase, partial [Deinococcus sp.]